MGHRWNSNWVNRKAGQHASRPATIQVPQGRLSNNDDSKCRLWFISWPQMWRSAERCGLVHHPYLEPWRLWILPHSRQVPRCTQCALFGVLNSSIGDCLGILFQQGISVVICHWFGILHTNLRISHFINPPKGPLNISWIIVAFWFGVER